jgi:hypothetical protein
MAETTVGQALGAGLRAVARQLWLAPVGMAVGLAQGLLLLPATAFGSVVAFLALRSLAERTPPPGPAPEEALRWLAAMARSPRFLGIAVGLWLAGTLLWAALRVAWISGAMPVLARELAGGQGGETEFPPGAAYRSGSVLVTATMAFLLDLVAQAMLVAVAGGALALAAPARRSGAAGTLALVAASAGVAAVFLAATLSVLGDAAVARAALSGEGPARSLWRSARALLRRPAAFVAAALGVLVATAVAVGSVQGAFGALAGSLGRAPRLLFLAPELLLWALVALVAAAAELWRLGTLGALALSTYPGGERRSSLRSDSLGMRPPSQ